MKRIFCVLFSIAILSTSFFSILVLASEDNSEFGTMHTEKGVVSLDGLYESTDLSQCDITDEVIDKGNYDFIGDFNSLLDKSAGDDFVEKEIVDLYESLAVNIVSTNLQCEKASIFSSDILNDIHNFPLGNLQGYEGFLTNYNAFLDNFVSCTNTEVKAEEYAELMATYYYSKFPGVPDFGRNLGISLYDSYIESDSGIYYYRPSSSTQWAVPYGDLLTENGFFYQGSTDLDSGGTMVVYAKTGYNVGLGVDYLGSTPVVFVFVSKTGSSTTYYYSSFPGVPDFGRNLGISLYDSYIESDSGIYYYRPSSSTQWAVPYGDLLTENGFLYQGSTDLDSGGTMVVYAKTGYNVGLGVDYLGNTPVVFVFVSKTGSSTQTYTISYNANGGSGAPSRQTKTHGVSLKLSTVVPTRTGYEFKGWATSSYGSVAYAPGSTYSSNSSITLYAVWQEKTYTVSYDANGGSGAPSKQTKTHGVGLILSTVVPTRTGYEFKGWATSSYGSVAYAPGSTYTSNSSTTLYAVWQEIIYTISYDANGGSGAPSSQQKKYGINLTLSSAEPTRSGYIFKGWSVTSNYESSFKPLSVSGLESAHDYSNNTNQTWTISSSGADSIVLTFDSRTAFESNYDFLYIYDEYGSLFGKYSGTTLAGKTITVPGDYLTLKLTSDNSYNYWGFKVTTAKAYSSSSSSPSVDYLPGDVYSSNSNITLYAVWKIPDEYNVTYNANGGTNAPSNQTKFEKTDLILSYVKPIKVGYDFLGWATSSHGSVVYTPGSTYTTDSSITLYAVWQEIVYTVSYNANGGAFNKNEQTKTYDVDLILHTEKPTREGHKFLGWATTENGEPEYQAGSVYSKNESVTLYAVWEIYKYSVEYIVNGATAPEAQVKVYGEPLTISEEVPAKEHYAFKGWSTEQGGEVVYNPGDEYTENADIVLYAVWEEVMGDISGDGKLTQEDINIAVSAIFGAQLAEEQFKYANVYDADNVINIKDLIKLAQMMSGK